MRTLAAAAIQKTEGVRAVLFSLGAVANAAAAALLLVRSTLFKRLIDRYFEHVCERLAWSPSQKAVLLHLDLADSRKRFRIGQVHSFQRVTNRGRHNQIALQF